KHSSFKPIWSLCVFAPLPEIESMKNLNPSANRISEHAKAQRRNGSSMRYRLHSREFQRHILTTIAVGFATFVTCCLAIFSGARLARGDALARLTADRLEAVHKAIGELKSKRQD